MHWMMYGNSAYGPGVGWGPWGYFGALGPLFIGGIALIALWTIFWKGWALWLAARRGEKVWFGVLLVLNTIGILEIIYIFLVAKRSDRLERHG